MGEDLAEASHAEGPEPDDAGCEGVPTDLVELHEVLEWEAAVRARDPGMAPGSDEPPGFA